MVTVLPLLKWSCAIQLLFALNCCFDNPEPGSWSQMSISLPDVPWLIFSTLGWAFTIFGTDPDIKETLGGVIFYGALNSVPLVGPTSSHPRSLTLHFLESKRTFTFLTHLDGEGSSCWHVCKHKHLCKKSEVLAVTKDSVLVFPSLLYPASLSFKNIRRSCMRNHTLLENCNLLYYILAPKITCFV